MQMTPQQLMDLPGYGSAEKALRKSGKWDDTLALDGTKEYNVTVKISGYYDPCVESNYYEVAASTKDDAIDLAMQSCDFDEIEDFEIVSVSEATE